jgi:PPP family 3-phenylpropionic acid transporter
VRGLRLLYLALGASTAALNPFLVVILDARGLDPLVIGVVIALGSAAMVGAVPAWGHIGDAIVGRRRALLAAVSVATATALVIATPVPSLILAGLVIAFMLSQGASLGLCDSLAVGIMSDPHRQYGRIRMLASFSFAVTSIPAGLIYNHAGYEAASIAYLLGATSIALALVWVPDHRPSKEVKEAIARAGKTEGPAVHRASRLGSTGLAFQVQPRLFGVLTTVFLAWFAVMISFTFLSLRIVDLGGTPFDVGMSFGISAFAEIPGMLVAAQLASRVGLRGLFAVGIFGYAAAFLSWTVLDTPAQIVASRLLTGVCYGFMTVGMVLTMGEILPGGLQATGQTLYQATATGLAAVVGNAVGGFLYDSAGSAFLFAACAGVAIAGGIVGWLTLPTRVRRVPIPAEVEEVVLPNSPVL